MCVGTHKPKLSKKRYFEIIDIANEINDLIKEKKIKNGELCILKKNVFDMIDYIE